MRKVFTVLDLTLVACAALIVAFASLFTISSLSSYRQVVAAKDAALAVDPRALEDIDALAMKAEEKYSRLEGFLISGEKTPYLDRMQDSRNDFLDLLRKLMSANGQDAVATDFLNRIGQAEMDHQLTLSKAIQMRRNGRHYVAITLLLASPGNAQRGALKTLLSEFRDYQQSRLLNHMKTTGEVASATASKVRGQVRWLGTITIAAVAVLFAGIVLIVLRRRALEKAAERQEARFRDTLQFVEAAPWERNLQSDYFAKSSAHFPLYGFAAIPPLWNFEMFMRSVAPSDRDRVRRALEDAVATKETYAIEFDVRWPNQSTHRLLSRGRILRGEDGKALAIRGLDILLDAREKPQPVIPVAPPPAVEATPAAEVGTADLAETAAPAPTSAASTDAPPSTVPADEPKKRSSRAKPPKDAPSNG